MVQPASIPVQMFIDEPQDMCVRTGDFTFSGWLAFPSGLSPAFSFHTQHTRLVVEWVNRADVESALGGRTASGFHVRVQIARHLQSVDAFRLRVYVCCNGVVAGCLTFKLEPGVIHSSLTETVLT